MDYWTKQKQRTEVHTTVKEADIKPIICYNCQEAGHKANECPKKEKKTRRESHKRVKTRQQEVRTLCENDVMATVGKYTFPVTLDSGAFITVLPREFVEDADLTGNRI